MCDFYLLTPTIRTPEHCQRRNGIRSKNSENAITNGNNFSGTLGGENRKGRMEIEENFSWGKKEMYCHGV